MIRFCLAAGLIGLLASNCVMASVMTIWGDPADSEVYHGGIFSYDPGANGGQVGVNGGFDYSDVYVFQLPGLGSGQAIGSAHFSFNDSASGSIYNVDLYGLAYRPAPTVLASDWYSGPNDAANTLLQSAIIPPSFTFSGRLATDSTGDAALASYLNDQYNAGAVGGDYVFLRLSSSVTNGNNAQVDFVDNADKANYLASVYGSSTLSYFQGLYSPELDVTITPEPSTAALVLLISAGFAARRRPR